MDSTLSDVTRATTSRFRPALRSVTLIALVGFLGAGLLGVFERPAQQESDDGVVTVGYDATVRAGNAMTLRIDFLPDSCEGPVITLTREYADLIAGLAAEPLPAASGAEPGGVHRWEFSGSPQWVTLSGHVADGWSPGVVGTLTIECAQTYEMELHTRRIP